MIRKMAGMLLCSTFFVYLAIASPLKETDSTHVDVWSTKLASKLSTRGMHNLRVRRMLTYWNCADIPNDVKSSPPVLPTSE